MECVLGDRDRATVEAVLSEFRESNESRRALLVLLDQGGDTAADSVASVILSGEPKGGEAAAWILTEMKKRGVAAALRVLGQDIEKEETARTLSLLLTHPNGSTAVSLGVTSACPAVMNPCGDL